MRTRLAAVRQGSTQNGGGNLGTFGRGTRNGPAPASAGEQFGEFYLRLQTIRCRSQTTIQIKTKTVCLRGAGLPPDSMRLEPCRFWPCVSETWTNWSRPPFVDSASINRILFDSILLRGLQRWPNRHPS